MLDEAREAPAAVARQLREDTDQWQAFGARLRAQPPTALLTIARGSSDHAAHYAAYMIMARLGRLVTSMPMSLITLYQSQIRCEGLASLAFSQSGQSPDLVGPTQYFRNCKAITCAFVNDPDSPLGRAAEWLFPLHAGPEKSVAATKSFIAQLVAGARLTAAWQDDDALHQALAALPTAMEQAVRQDWTSALDILQDADRLFVVGRGLGLPVAMEAALKFKETCGIQAEAFSGAEIQHGPMRLIEEHYPLLVFAPRGPAQAGLLELGRTMRARGARVLLAAPAGTPEANLTLVESAVPELDPVCAIQSFYPMVEALARARGNDPDSPPHLKKVTKTS
ncbi:MAG TPA: SIS domain-containing protein [Ramlibacter sp.]|nr:SIS domain-containing protein [Ramlibacter sp.]